MSRTLATWIGCSALLACTSPTTREQVDAPLRPIEARTPFWLGPVLGSPARRVVSLAPSVTEIIFALEANDRLVGVTRFCDYPASALELPRVGGFLDPSLEAVLALKPDLVITVPNGQNQIVVERLAELDTSILVVYAYDLSDVPLALEAIGKALHIEARAQGLWQQIEVGLQATTRRLPAGAPPSVLFLYGHRPLVAAGPGSYADDLITLAGGRNVLAHALMRYPTLSLEGVIGLAPEIIVDAYAAGHGESDGFSIEQVTVIPAVASGRYYRLWDNMALRPGPRAPRDVRLLAGLFHALHDAPSP